MKDKIRSKAKQAVAKLRQSAKKNGLASMSLTEINNEIRAARVPRSLTPEEEVRRSRTRGLK